MQVTAAVVAAPGAPFAIRRLQLDEPRPDEILVRVAAAGICHTDLVARAGMPGLVFPAVFGHEGAGTVLRVGTAVTKVRPGDRVAMTFRSCGHCARCTAGDPAYCHSMPLLNFTGARPDGSRSLRDPSGEVSANFFGQSSFATHALAYERNVIRLPEDISFAMAAPLGCGVQTGAGAVMRALACPPGSTILITGGGAVGLSAAMGAAIRQCSRIIVVEPLAARRVLAQELGATDTIDPSAAADLAGTVRALLPQGVDFALDTTGRGEILSAAMAALGPKGVLGIVGIPPADAPIPGDLMTLFALGQGVRGIIEGDSEPDSFLPELIEHWRAGRLPLEKLVDTFPLDRIEEAIAAQHRGDCVKAVLTFPES